MTDERKIPDDKMNELVEYLQGSCKSLEDGLRTVLDDDGADMNSMSLEDCRELDDKIFNCEICNWWCDVGNTSSKQPDDDDRLICTQCAGDQGWGEED